MTANCPPGEATPRSSAPALIRLKKRADFVAASKGRRQNGRGFTLQTTERRVALDLAVARIGLTVTRKTGNSVVRNRIRRRLREALRLAQGLPVSPAHDYVVFARRELVSIAFAEIGAELKSAFRKIHALRPRKVVRNP